MWKINNSTGKEELIGGLAYYFVPPSSFTDIINNPGHFLIYFLFVTITCAIFSRIWLDLSGKSSIDILKQFHESNMTVAGVQREHSVFKYLNRYIPTAAILGGIAISILSIFSDLLGTIGSGTGLLLVVNIIYSYYETIRKESDLFTKGNPLVEF